MSDPNDDKELLVLLDSAETAGEERERGRIIDLLQDAAVQQSDDGDIDGAQIIAEIIRLIHGSVAADEMIETAFDGPGDPEPIAELPPAVERSDEESMVAAMKSLQWRPGT